MNNKKMGFIIKTTAQVLLVVIITAAFAVFIKLNFQQIKETIKIKPFFLFLIVLLYLLNRILMGLKIRTIVGVFNIKLSFFRCFAVAVITNFYNYIMPKGGTALAGVYLKNNHGLNYSGYISLLLISGIVTLLVLGVLGFAATLYVYGAGLLNNIAFFVIFGLMIIIAIILLLLNRFYLFKKVMPGKFTKFLQGWDLLSKNISSVIVLFLIDVCVVLILAVRYYILFKVFSLDISIIKCILIAPFNILIHFITVIPGAYGVKEATVGLVAKLANIGFTPGVLTTFSDRIIIAAISFILGPICSFILLKHFFIFRREVANNA